MSFTNCISASTASTIIWSIWAGELVVEQVGLLAVNGVDHLENAKSMRPLSSRNTQLVPAASPLSRPFIRRK